MSRREDWETPQEVFNKYNTKYGPLTWDYAASAENAKCEQFYTIEDDALERNWSCDGWLNPPYGRTKTPQWLTHAAKQADDWKIKVVCLVPASTSTRWFHDLVLPKAKHIEFIRGRIRFVGATGSPRFDSMIVVFDGNKPMGPAMGNV